MPGAKTGWYSNPRWFCLPKDISPLKGRYDVKWLSLSHLTLTSCPTLFLTCWEEQCLGLVTKRTDLHCLNRSWSLSLSSFSWGKPNFTPKSDIPWWDLTWSMFSPKQHILHPIIFQNLAVVKFRTHNILSTDLVKTNLLFIKVENQIQLIVCKLCLWNLFMRMNSTSQKVVKIKI